MSESVSVALSTRNDIGEYYGEQLEDFCFLANGWVMESIA